MPALVLSCLSILFCCLFVSLPGMIMGKLDMDAIDQGRTDPANRSMAKAAFIIGATVTGINVAFWGLYLVLVLSSLGSL